MKKHQNLTVLFLCFLYASLPFSYGQDLQNAGKSIQTRIHQKDLFRFSGNLAANLRFHSISGIPTRSDPFSFRLAANLNLDFLGIKTPFSAAVSDGDLTYRYPSYAFAGISPVYKWITVHAGDRTLNFSPYTFTGHHFHGAGLELKPGKFYFAAFTGRLRRARPEEAGQIQRLDPVFKRTGWGIKTGITDGSNAFHLILFSARDEAPSFEPTDTLHAVSPEANTVFGLQIKRQIGKLAMVDLDFARSALTRDTRSPEIEANSTVFLSRVAGLFRPRISSGYHNAFSAALRLKPGVGEFSLQFERIDPGYRTLGALFFNNDLENLTLGATLPLFKKKLVLATNGGLQRNNLRQGFDNGFRRLIGSVQLNMTAAEKWNLNLSFSNFSTTTRFTIVQTPFVEVDSVILVQTNQSANLSFSYLGGNEKNSVSSLMLAYQNAYSIQNDSIRNDLANTWYMGLVSHQFTSGNGRWRLGGSCLVHYSAAPGAKLFNIGPGVNTTLALARNKIQVRSVLSCSKAYSGYKSPDRVLQAQFSIGWNMGKNQGLDGQLSFVNAQKQTPITGPPGFREWILSLGYFLRFNG